MVPFTYKGVIYTDRFSNQDIFQSLEYFIVTNSADPDKKYYETFLPGFSLFAKIPIQGL